MSKRLTAVFVFSFISTLLVSAQPQVNITPYCTGINGRISDVATNGDGRLYVTTQMGSIYIISQGGVLNSIPFLNIQPKVTPTSVNNTGEQGLLGLAFSPDYANDQTFYIYYTNKSGIGNSILARYKVTANPDIADSLSEEILLDIQQPYTNHNGGCLKFGNDGFLYLGLGDGGSNGDPGNLAQNMNEYFGKILRIDVSSQPTGYTIPATNPYYSVVGAKQEIWASGFRNPWKFSFDKLTHDLWIGDVGESTWEEIDFQPASSTGGENYGWRCYEGNATFNNSAGCNGSYTSPVYDYSHSATGGCSVTGGFVYRGTLNPSIQGIYFFADYCNGSVYALDPNNQNSVVTAGAFSGNFFSTFGEDDSGELYLGDNNNGTLYKIVWSPTGVNDINPSANVSYSVKENAINISIHNTDANFIHVELLDMNGRQLLKQFSILHKGNNQLQIPVKLANSTYIIRIISDRFILTKKITVCD